ncbi:MAG: macro domain-containing protein [Roseburia sp.]|nr:macro domain-containing protein [Roseburia sp.]
MPFKIVRNDITKMHVDAIVNTANEAPQYSDGVDRAVYHAAGVKELLAERKKIGWMKEGEVAITPGFKLPAKYIIHAVSPCYIDGTFGEEQLLRECYSKSLQLAYENKCETIAFPLISTGCFGYPKEEGMRIALDEINAFLMSHDMLVYLVVFDTESTKLGLNLYPNLEAYIDHNYVCEKREEEYGNRYFGSVVKGAQGYDAYKQERERVEKALKVPVEIDECCMSMETVCSASSKSISVKDMDVDSYKDFYEENESALKERMKHMSDTFQQYLLYLIEVKGLTPAEVYKRAIITKQLFSKIKVNPNYHPDKATAMRLCVGVKLNIDETKDLLSRAGYALSPCDKRDIIFSFFIENNVHDMIEIDIALEEHGLPCFIE